VLLRQLQQLDPDVLLVQELCPQIAACVLEALPGHLCIADGVEGEGEGGRIEEGQRGGKELFEGWRQEGNIFFRSSLFRLQQWGQEHIGQEEELRRLFWARLQPRAFPPGSSHTLLFSTAHFTWQGHPRELETDLNLRKAQARRSAAALDTLQVPGDLGCFFGGDLNESFWPQRVLQAAGFVDCFSALGLPCRPTHPCRPTLAHEDQNADAVLDWVFARGAPHLHPPLPPDSASSFNTSDLLPSPSSGSSSSNSTQQKEQAAVTGQECESTVRALVATVVKDSVGLSSSDPQEARVLGVQPSDHAPVLAVYRCSARI
jgi:hypothetical protein